MTKPILISTCALDPREKKLNGHHLVVPYLIDTPTKRVKSRFLLNSGAEATSFINNSFVRINNIPSFPLSRLRALHLADGSGTNVRITHYALVDITIGNYIDQVGCYITNLS